MAHSRWIVVALTAAVLVSCTSEPEEAAEPADSGRVVQLGPPGEPGRELTDQEIAELEQPGHTFADVWFVQSMIPHHEQALIMTELVEERTSREDVTLLARRIELSQHDEIAQLTHWLEERGEEVPLPGSGHGGHQSMPGMLTDTELAELAAATGGEFDRLFLEYMIRHHEGAVVMVEELLGGSGGQEPEVFQLARHIDADQQVEIARMKRMLAELP
jgi:uncharacterized protein (DUF305 family)